MNLTVPLTMSTSSLQQKHSICKKRNREEANLESPPSPPPSKKISRPLNQNSPSNSKLNNITVENLVENNLLSTDDILKFSHNGQEHTILVTETGQLQTITDNKSFSSSSPTTICNVLSSESKYNSGWEELKTRNSVSLATLRSSCFHVLNQVDSGQYNNRKNLIQNSENTIEMDMTLENDNETNSNSLYFSSHLKITKDVKCTANFSPITEPPLDNINEITNSISNLTKIRITDFSKRTVNSPLCIFKIEGNNIQDKCSLAYLRGLLERKGEAAVVPIGNTEYQLRIFENDEFLNIPRNSLSLLSSSSLDDEEIKALSNSITLDLCCALVRKPNLILDLDDTLVRTRIPKTDADQPKESRGEYELYVSGSRMICAVRPGTESLLAWSCNLFSVYIFTNSVYEYAKQVLEILDPKHEHLLKQVQNDKDLNHILKTRKDMTPNPEIKPPLGIKDLEKFSLDKYNSIILDDDDSVWAQSSNLLPFQKFINLRKGSEFFYEVRSEAWKKLDELHLQYIDDVRKNSISLSPSKTVKECNIYSLNQVVNHSPTKSRKTYSQSHVSNSIGIHPSQS